MSVQKGNTDVWLTEAKFQIDQHYINLNSYLTPIPKESQTTLITCKYFESYRIRDYESKDEEDNDQGKIDLTKR